VEKRQLRRETLLRGPDGSDARRLTAGFFPDGTIQPAIHQGDSGPKRRRYECFKEPAQKSCFLHVVAGLAGVK
jgi:hypothetical protein